MPRKRFKTQRICLVFSHNFNLRHRKNTAMQVAQIIGAGYDSKLASTKNSKPSHVKGIT